jgi:putative phosphoesterase
MKLYLVISDTHGSIYTARTVIEKYGQIDGLIHLGDHYKDAVILKETQFKDLDMYMVPGNCDFVADVPSEIVLEAEDKRILLTHGHRFNVKNGLDRLEKYALRQNTDAVLFGHTHAPLQEIRSDIVFLNPGSLGYPRGSSPTYGLLEISKNAIETRILNI